MDKKKTLKFLVIMMFGMFLANDIINKFHFYDTVWWVDIVMHFLGGFWVSLFFLYIFHDKLPKEKHLLVISLCVIFIGVGWELFEFVMDQIAKAPNNFSDSFSDLVLDIIGGLGAMYYNEANAKHG